MADVAAFHFHVMPLYVRENGDFRPKWYEKRCETYDEAAAYMGHMMNDVGHREVAIICCERDHADRDAIRSDTAQ